MIWYHYDCCQACPSIPYLRYDGVEAAVSGRLETGESPTSPAPTSPSSTWSPSSQGTDHCPSLFVWKKNCGRNVIATVWADIMGELSQDNPFHLHPPVEYVAVKTVTNQTYRLHLDISRKNYSFSCIHFILIGYQYFG